MISRYEKQLLYVLIVVCLFGTFVFKWQFLSVATLSIVANQIPELGIIALALMITMIGSGINLSVISMTTLSGVIGGMFMINLADLGGFSVIIGIVLILVVGVILGGINGFIISYIEVPALLTTLGTMLFFQGISLNLTKGGSIAAFPKLLSVIGNGSIVGVPVPLIIFVFIAFVLHYVLNETLFGQHLYKIGKDKRAARYSGISVKQNSLKAYLLAGLLIGLAAFIMTARYNSIRVDYGSSYLMTSIVIVSLGGVNINGGRGSVFGVVVALLLVSVIIRILSLANIDTDLIEAVLGLLLLTNILIQYILNKKQDKKNYIQ